jgi:hypothetical protein
MYTCLNVHSLLAMVAVEFNAYTAVICYILPSLNWTQLWYDFPWVNQETLNFVFLINNKADPDM